jgi:hypothetical protein
MAHLMHKEIESLKKIFKEYHIDYIPIEDAELLMKIYNLFQNGIIFEPVNGFGLRYIGLYYDCIKSDYVSAEKYYRMAIEQGDDKAMSDLAIYYDDIKKDYVNMEKYYLMAIERGNIDAMNNLAIYYKNKKKDYINAKKYYLIAIDHGCVKAMYNLAFYYKDIKDYVNMEIYYLMAVEHGDVDVMNDLAHYYEYTKKDIVKLIELYIKNKKLVERNKIINEIKKIWIFKLDSEQSVRLVELLSTFELLPDDDVPTLLRMFINMLQQNVDIMRLHFEYTLTFKGYEEAKEDFISLIIGSTNNNLVFLF